MTSQLNDLIARSSVVAFNSGLDAGKREAEQRVMRILDELAMDSERGEYAYISDIKDYIKDETIK
jgi:hypothetical protein